MRIILASGSPRRAELMSLAGFKFDVIIPDVDESIPCGTSAENAVKLLSSKKAKYVHSICSDNSIIVAADTVVSIDDMILGKPHSVSDARKMLKLLSGRTHSVFTGVSVIKNGAIRTFASESLVTFYPLSDMDIDDYIKSGEPMDKAGAYGIQGKGCLLVKNIKGDYFNIVGLPIAETARIIRN